MATLASETWAGASGAAWPAQFTVGAQAGTATQTGAGRGLITAPATTYSPAKSWYLAGMTATLAQEFYGTLTFSSLLVKYHSICLRSDGTITNLDPTNGYMLYLQPDLTTVTVNRVVAGTKTVVASPTFTYQNAELWIRFSVDTDHRVRLRLWYGGAGAEPSTWLIDQIDAAPYNVAGRVMATHGSGSETTASFSYGPLTITDTPTGGGSSAPSSWTVGAQTTLDEAPTTTDSTANRDAHLGAHTILHQVVNWLTARLQRGLRVGGVVAGTNGTAATTTSTTATAIAALTWNLQPGAYALDVYGAWRSSVTTAYPRFGLGAGAAPAATVANVDGWIETAASAASRVTAVDGVHTGAAAAAAATDYRLVAHICFQVTAAGNVALKWLTSSAGTQTLQPGTYGILTRLG